jgi:DNA-binding LytR/AlgR family response regulator
VHPGFDGIFISGIEYEVEKVVVVRIPLGDLEEKLPAQRFARTHRSYIINLKWLQSVDLQDMTVLIKDRQVPLSKGFREQILGRLDQV